MANLSFTLTSNVLQRRLSLEADKVHELGSYSKDSSAEVKEYSDNTNSLLLLQTIHTPFFSIENLVLASPSTNLSIVSPLGELAYCTEITPLSGIVISSELITTEVGESFSGCGSETLFESSFEQPTKTISTLIKSK